VLVGDEGEPVEVGVEGTQRVDLRAVACARGLPAMPPHETSTPVFEIRIDLVRTDAAGVTAVEPAPVARECFAVFAAGAVASCLADKVGVERLQQRRVRACGWWCGERSGVHLPPFRLTANHWDRAALLVDARQCKLSSAQ